MHVVENLKFKDNCNFSYNVYEKNCCIVKCMQVVFVRKRCTVVVRDANMMISINAIYGSKNNLLIIFCLI